MDPTVEGCAAAALSIGYTYLAALILEERMGPERIARENSVLLITHCDWSNPSASALYNHGFARVAQ